jgi:hypothetical protein
MEDIFERVAFHNDRKSMSQRKIYRSEGRFKGRCKNADDVYWTQSSTIICVWVQEEHDSKYTEAV